MLKRHGTHERTRRALDDGKAIGHCQDIADNGRALLHTAMGRPARRRADMRVARELEQLGGIVLAPRAQVESVGVQHGCPLSNPKR